jgi:hypothetical protein
LLEAYSSLAVPGDLRKLAVPAERLTEFGLGPVGKTPREFADLIATDMQMWAEAVEQTDALVVPFQEVMELLLKKPDLIVVLVDVLCRALKEAYAQVNTLAIDDTVRSSKC